MISKVLVVCIGNICQSPYAEAVLNEKLKGSIKIGSAGIGVEFSGLVGHGADFTGMTYAHGIGVDLSKHRAKQLTPYLCSQYDLILVMEQKHIELVSTISPESRGKTMLLGHWIDKEMPTRISKVSKHLNILTD